MAEAGDKLLKCVDCGAEFMFSARDQAFYEQRGYQAPRRCKNCRDKRKTGGGNQSMGGAEPGNTRERSYSGSSRGEYGGGRGDYGGGRGDYGGGRGGGGDASREQFKVTCTSCGIETTVPFKPDSNRPVYCRTCYLQRRKSGMGD